MRRHEEKSLDMAAKFAVHEGQLELVFEVRYGTQTAHNGLCTLLFRIPHKKSFERLPIYSRIRLYALSDHVQAFFQREYRVSFLFRIHAEGHDYPVEGSQRTSNYFEMTIVKRVKRPWIDGNLFVHSCISPTHGFPGIMRRSCHSGRLGASDRSWDGSSDSEKAPACLPQDPT